MAVKKFKNTNVGRFLASNSSNIVDTLGSILPNAGVLGIVKNLIERQPMPVADKEKALKLLELDQIELQEVSKRWSSDLASDNKLSKNVRPLTLIVMTTSLILFILLDSIFIDFKFSDSSIQTLTQLCSVIYIAYFGGRSYEKTRK
tara:strand:+ start:18401 stop:18838 length:438 start_codon:yes stop_codon:yes gene_type:complete